jgi:hypothetical protein
MALERRRIVAKACPADQIDFDACFVRLEEHQDHAHGVEKAVHDNPGYDRTRLLRQIPNGHSKEHKWYPGQPLPNVRQPKRKRCNGNGTQTAQLWQTLLEPALQNAAKEKLLRDWRNDHCRYKNHSQRQRIAMLAEEVDDRMAVGNQLIKPA